MKNLFAILLLSTFSLTSFANSHKPGDGKVVLLITIQVKDFNTWKKGFDANAAVREKAGIKVITIASEENGTKVLVVEQAENRKSAEDFLNKLKEKMKETGAAPVEVKILDKED